MSDESKVRTQFFENQAKESAAPFHERLHVRILGIMAIAGFVFCAYQAVMYFLNLDKINAMKSVEVAVENPEFRDGAAIVDVRIGNMNATSVSNIVVKYDISGPSGSTVASGVVPLPEPVPPGDVRTFRHVKLATFEGESRKMKVELADLKVGPKPELDPELEGQYLELTALKGDEAKQGFEAFIKKAPKFVPGYICLARAYMEEKNFAQAATVLEQAVALDTSNADAHYNLGVALSNKGDRAGAERELEEAIKLAPNDPDIQRTIQYMR